MSGVTWSVTLGEGRALSWVFSLIDGQVGEEVVSADVGASWGSFELIVDGLGLCETVQEGEQLRSAHWYLLPVAEWLVENWLALFHEPHLPLTGQESAAESLAHADALLETSRPAAGGRWSFPTTDPEELFEQTQQWDHRHRLSAAAPEAPLPDVWLRRDGTHLEVSVGNELRPLFDDHVRWRVERQTLRIPVTTAAAVTERAVRSLLTELTTRRPGGRAAAALTRLDAVVGADAGDERLAWLLGLRGDTAALGAIRAEVDAAFTALAPEEHTPALVAAPVATLFGSLNPHVAQEDLHALFGALKGAAPVPYLLAELDRLALAVPLEDVRGLPYGAAGGELGDAAAQLLPVRGGRVQIVDYVTDMGITLTRVALQDSSLRAVTLLHDDARAVIAINSNYEWGTADHVVRFTLAHELAHLVYDRLQATTLAIASGPWAPRRIEQRANGFAAGLLMPEKLLRELTAADGGWPEDPHALVRLARQLGVGVTALAERLPNAGLLSKAAAAAMLDALTSSR